MRRIAIIGTPGNGKTTLARQLASRLDIAHVELDAHFHQPGWTHPDNNVFRRVIHGALDSAEVSAGGWVVDGNYVNRLGEDYLARCDTIVWLDLPRRTVVARVARRTVRRLALREELWNGNREPMSNLVRWDPEHNIVRWSWVKHPFYRSLYGERRSLGAWDHAEVHHLTTPSEVERLLSSAASA